MLQIEMIIVFFPKDYLIPAYNGFVFYEFSLNLKSFMILILFVIF